MNDITQTTTGYKIVDIIITTIITFSFSLALCNDPHAFPAPRFSPFNDEQNILSNIIPVDLQHLYLAAPGS